MTIAFISSICKPTTIFAKGGQEVWAAQFLNEDIKHNNTFDLYAIKDSLNIPSKISLKEVLSKGKDEIKYDDFFQHSPTKQKDLDLFADAVYTKIAIELTKNQQKYDLLIDSSGSPILSYSAEEFTQPIIIIGHFPVSKQYARFYKYFKIPKKLFFIFPSRYQYEQASWINPRQKFLVPHGIDTTTLSSNHQSTSNLLWYGRVDPEMPKGIDIAIEIAQKLKKPIDIFPYIEEDAQNYFETQILPKISQPENVHIHKDSVPKNLLFAQAKALISPIQWEEPFGLVMIEAMATGTPVVGFARGAVPEIIKDGETGFIVNPSDQDIRGDWIIKKTGIEGFSEAVKRIYAMTEEQYNQMRKNCREHVEEKFTVKRMVDSYEKIYQQILSSK